MPEHATRDSELRLQMALDATGDGLWDWNLETGACYLSPSYYALTGYRPDEVEGNFDLFRRLVHPDDFPGVMTIIEAHMRGETPFSHVEYRMVTASGEIRHIRGRGRVVARSESGAPLRMLGLITDITAYEHIEAALRESERRLRAVVEDQTESIVRMRVDGTFVFANEVYCRLFGLNPETIVGKKWQPIAHSDDLQMIESRLAELTPDHPVVTIENRVFAANGETRWMQFVNRAFFDDGGNIREIQAVGRDITERKQGEAIQAGLLRENILLGRELIRLQEKERHDLARELHDELSQQLAAIRAFAAAIQRGAGRDKAKLQVDVAAIDESARHIYSVSHRIMEGLHPHILDSGGLVEGLKSMVAGWQAKHPGTRVICRFAEDVTGLDDEVMIHFFRIAQECMANVAAHSGAGVARIFLHVRRDGAQRRLRLVVRDNGQGMDMDAPRRGYGLIVMRERAYNVGARFDLYSRPGRGVRIMVEAPCPD